MFVNQSTIGRTLIFALTTCITASLGASRAAAEAQILVDVETGKVLHAENATQPWYPASITKIMTTYVTLRAVKEGRITLDKLLTVSPNAIAQSPVKMGFPVGTTITVDNALKILLVKSANDMAVVARAAIREFPEYDYYWHLPGIRFGKKVMRNYNTLIGRYPGADGMKT